MDSERDLLPVMTENPVGIPRIPRANSPRSLRVCAPQQARGEIWSSAPRALRETVDAPAHRRTSAPSPAQPGAAVTLSRHFRARMRSGGSGACAGLGSSQLQPLVLTLLLPFPHPQPAAARYQRVVPPGEPCVPRAPRTPVVFPALAMEMEQVNALCEELVKAVTVMMDPSSTQRYRLEALKVAGVLAAWACPEIPIPGFPHGLSKLSSSPASAAFEPPTPCGEGGFWSRPSPPPT